MVGDGRNGQFGYGEATYDPKTGRFTLPAVVFAKLGETRLRLTIDPLGRFIELRSDASFLALADRVRAAAPHLPPETAAALLTDYLGFSAEVTVDNIMRLVVPKGMRDALADDADLALVAVGDAVRVWSQRRFREAQAEQRRQLAAEYSKFAGVLLGFGGAAAPAAPAGGAGDGTGGVG